MFVPMQRVSRVSVRCFCKESRRNGELIDTTDRVLNSKLLRQKPNFLQAPGCFPKLVSKVAEEPCRSCIILDHLTSM